MKHNASLLGGVLTIAIQSLFFQSAIAQFPDSLSSIYVLGDVTKLNSLTLTSDAGKAGIIKAIGQTRVVLLGEQTHFDGRTFVAKVNLVKLLREELGFDVIAFEGDLFALDVLNREFQNGGDLFSLAKNELYGVWTYPSELAPLYEYLNESNKSKPVYLAGFDCRHSRHNSRMQLVSELTKYLNEIAYDVQSERFSRFSSILTNLIDKEFNSKTPEEDQVLFLSVLGEFKKVASRTSGSPQKSFFLALIQSIEGFSKVTWSIQTVNEVPTFLDKYDNKYGNLRDVQMGQNAAWLLSDRFKNHKVILWGASYHLIRGLGLMDTLKTTINLSHANTMADVLTSKGQKYYSIGFSSYEGSWGPDKSNPILIKPARKGSMEDVAVSAGLEYAFINLTYRKEFSMRPLGHTEMIAHWANMLNGVIFIREARQPGRP